MVIVSPHLSTITLNGNGLYSPLKRHRVAEWLKQKTHLCAAHKRLTSAIKKQKVKG